MEEWPEGVFLKVLGNDFGYCWGLGIPQDLGPSGKVSVIPQASHESRTWIIPSGYTAMRPRNHSSGNRRWRVEGFKLRVGAGV